MRSSRSTRATANQDTSDSLPSRPARSTVKKEDISDDLPTPPRKPTLKKEATADGPNEYELQRLANIEKNKQLLRDLQLNAAASGLGIKKKATPASKPRTSSERKSAAPRRKAVPVDLGPRRTSSRLAGLTADSEVAKRKAEDEYEAIVHAERAKRQRKSGDMDLGDIFVSGKSWEQGASGSLLGATRYEKTFTQQDVDETKDESLKEVRQRMNNMKLYAGFSPNNIKITPERIYSIGLHPTPDKPLVFAGDKLGSLGIFDASQEIPPAYDSDGDEVDSDGKPTLSIFQPHARTITSIVFADAEPNAVYTSSYDSSVRKLDLAAGKSVEVWSPPDPSQDYPVSCIEIHPLEPSTLYLSTLNGEFGVHDMRAPSSESTLYALSDKKIGNFAVMPKAPHLIATASLDRFLRIWDLRKMMGREKDRHPALLGEHESRLSVSGASWNALGQLATSSYDNTIKVHNLSDGEGWKVGHDITEEEMEPMIIPHNNQTGRWVTILKPVMQKNPRDGVQKLAIGNMDRWVDVYGTAGGEILAQYDGGGLLTAVPAVAKLHDTENWVVGGTASGKLALWGWEGANGELKDEEGLEDEKEVKEEVEREVSLKKEDDAGEGDAKPQGRVKRERR